MAISEQTLWDVHKTLAETALDFWVEFLDLQEGNANNTLLTNAYKSHFLCIIRAVSWVESRHGSGTGLHPDRDPMQCANPNDSWWKSVTHQSGNSDRFVRGPNLTPNYWAHELPIATSATTAFPVSARLAQLTSQNKGHDDAAFVPAISYYWGIPYLIQRINTHTNLLDGKTYKCDTYSKSRLIRGAVAYNGGGDPNYETKLNLALSGEIGCSLP